MDFPVPPAVEYSELEKEQNGQPVHPLPSHAPAPPPTLDEPVAPVQVPATEVLAVTDSEAYCSKIEGMSKTEVDEEAKWQIWKFEKEIGKVGVCVCVCVGDVFVILGCEWSECW